MRLANPDTNGANDMLHDQECELSSAVVTFLGAGCHCAARAYARDPLPDDTAPVYAESKTPGQEGG